ncbi:hypothetical protein PoB_000729800 [Plakobranchus ocellatus]|uniref:Uncharacterized protein n=1 Tax=Plakobranchus ocellatus TaxID=259542 RepID=A0AAV3YE88_9GAST|nr:hypothetical protein PoB_000729800 [Plakobranchus ocellatus]
MSQNAVQLLEKSVKRIKKKKKLNHFAKMCRSMPNNTHSSKAVHEITYPEKAEEHDFVAVINEVTMKETVQQQNTAEWTVLLEAGNKMLQAHFATKARVKVMAQETLTPLERSL